MNLKETETVKSVVLYEISEPFIKSLKQIEKRHTHNLDLLSQFTIDYLQGWDDELGDELQNLTADFPGASAYYASTLLEVMKGGYDASIVAEFQDCFSEWSKAIDKANKVYGFR